MPNRDPNMDVKSGPGRKKFFKENEIIRFCTIRIQLDVLQIVD